MSSNQENNIRPVLQLIHPDLLEKETSSQINNVTPNINFIPGEFKYIRDKNKRFMLANAWQAITSTGTWDFMEKHTGSFMFSTEPKIIIITDKMSKLGYDSHCPASFGNVMKAMQYIAVYGESKFQEEYIKKSM